MKHPKHSGFAGVLKLFALCWGYDKLYILHLTLCQIYKIILTISTILLPQYIIDSTFTDHDLTAALYYIAAFCGVFLLFSFLSSLSKKLIYVHKMRIFKQFQLSIGDTMMGAEFEEIESKSFLDLKAKAERFLYGDGSGFGAVIELFFELFGHAITLLTLSAFISQLNVLIVLLLLVILGINTVVNYRTQKKNIAVYREKAVQERQTMYYAAVTQDFRYGKEIRSFNLADWLHGKYAAQLTRMEQFYKRLANNSFSYETVVAITATAQQVAAYVYVVMSGVRGLITAGQFSMYLSSISTFSSTLKSIAASIIQMQQYTQYYEDYKRYMEIKSLPSDSVRKVPDSFSSIEFRNVSFRYNGQPEYALKNVNLTIQAGDKILLAGENGAGKSTLVKLLLRIYKPTEGTILLDGVDIQNFSFADYTRLFSSVFQDYMFFAFSLKDNIELGHPEDAERLQRILQDTGLRTKLDTLPNGLDTTVYREFDNNGYTPSGGEGQRLAMCRAIYNASSVVILDEPTAALDPKTENELYQMFDALFPNQTAVYISHRMASAKLCNRIVVLQNGEIAEEGTHEILMRKDGIYAQFFRLQAESYQI